MKDVLVDPDGTLRCPKCNSATFDRGRTGKAKVGGAVTIGLGVFLMPKRMKCLQCGTVSKSGNARPSGRAAAADVKSTTAMLERFRTPPVAVPAIAAKLKELEKLHTDGLVTDEEYSTKRAELLAHL